MTPRGGGAREGSLPPAHTARFSADNSTIAPDGRLFSGAFVRNFPPILAALVPWLGAGPGAVLEIGCGTGQHAASFALGFPELSWWPSDPDAGHRASARAWQHALGAHARAPLDVDAAALRDNAEIAALAPLRAVVALNVIHISPFAVCKGIVAGAARHLAPGGLLIFYGPFIEDGQHTGAGNAQFHAGLQRDNPQWGLRDLGEVTGMAGTAGFSRAAVIAMPANNRLLILRRT